MKTFADVLRDITDSISRKKGSYGVAFNPNTTEVPAPFALAAGSWRAINVKRGFIVSMALSRDQLTQLRDDCNELLLEHGDN